eukprot:COSAG04_NODE_9884_length_824_cov_0.744828_2_plen_44_part_01
MPLALGLAALATCYALLPLAAADTWVESGLHQTPPVHWNDMDGT